MFCEVGVSVRAFYIAAVPRIQTVLMRFGHFCYDIQYTTIKAGISDLSDVNAPGLFVAQKFIISYTDLLVFVSL